MSNTADIPTGSAPDPGTWTIDGVHSFVSFTLQHFNVGIATGIASGPSGTISIGSTPEETTVTAQIDASTLTTANAARDEKILGPDVLDIEKFPTIDFASTALRARGEQTYDLEGDLTIRDVTRPVTLRLVNRGVVVDTWGKARLGLTASTELDRNDFGAGDWAHVPLALGGFMVPHQISVALHIEATQEEPAS